IEVQPDIPYAPNAFGVAPDFCPWRREVHRERPVFRSLIAFQPGFDATPTDRVQNNGQPRVRLRRDLRPCRPRLYVDLNRVHGDVVGDACDLTDGFDSVRGPYDRVVAAKTIPVLCPRISGWCVSHRHLASLTVAHTLTQPHFAARAQILDLFAEDNRLNVYAGELDVRTPLSGNEAPWGQGRNQNVS